MFACLCLEMYTARLLQRLIGCAHERCCMNIFHRTFRWLAEFDHQKAELDGGPPPLTFEMSMDIRQEFSSAAFLVFCANPIFGREFLPEFACTDATPVRGGVGTSRVTQELAGSLYTRGLHGGLQDTIGLESLGL